MHKRLVINIVSRIVIVISFFMLLPLGWAAWDDLYSAETRAFLMTITFGLVVAYFLRWRFHSKLSDFDKLNTKDALAVVGLSWVILSFFGALPFYFSLTATSFTDAFFETVSGFTTTGASIFSDVEILPRGILLWRSLTQWLGGMGIMVLSVALLPVFNKGAFQFYKAEAPGPTKERLQPKIKETAKILWSVYLLFSVAEVVCLMAADLSFFDALCHTFTTMATGGFSTKNASIAAFGPTVQWIVAVFMFLAGINFILHCHALKGKPLSYFKNEEFRVYVILLVVAIPIFALTLEKQGFFDSAVRDSAFQAISILTTTGFVTTDFNTWPLVLKLILVALMFIGGCAGSTGGGMKVVRVFVSLKIALRSIKQAIFPNAVLPIKIDKTPVEDRLLTGVLSYFIIFIFLFFFGTIFLTISEGCGLQTAFSASIASLSNIGPGLGAVGATANYSWISVSGKWMLGFLMLAGRLELYSILVLFLPATWRK